eukprot:5865836-Prymnesium_polylepis.1
MHVDARIALRARRLQRRILSTSSTSHLTAGTSDTWRHGLTLHTRMMHTCTHPAARGHVPACPDGAPCLPAC